MRASIYAVAERAGVSISTVSLAINHPERVSTATRARIIEAARELGYRPLSQDGQTRGGHVAGVLVAAPFSAHPSFARRLNGIVGHLQGTGADVMVHDLPAAEAADEPLLSALPVRANVDGVIVMGVPLAEGISEKLRSWGPPLVAVDTQFGANPTVLIDDHAGAKALAEHFVGLGHRRIAYVHPHQQSLNYVSAGMDRMTGLASALDVPPITVEHVRELLATQESPRRFGDLTLLEVDRDDPASFDAAAAFFRENPDVTAAFAHHDELAAMLLSALGAHGVRVPEDVSLAGYDDGTLAQALGLTTVSQPFEESGRVAAELLQGMLGALRSVTQRIMLQPELVIRSTTGQSPLPLSPSPVPSRRKKS